MKSGDLGLKKQNYPWLAKKAVGHRPQIPPTLPPKTRSVKTRYVT